MSKEAYAYELLGGQKERVRQAEFLKDQYWALVHKAADLLHESAYDLGQATEGEGAKVMGSLLKGGESLQRIMGRSHRTIEQSVFHILKGTGREPKKETS